MRQTSGIVSYVCCVPQEAKVDLSSGAERWGWGGIHHEQILEYCGPDNLHTVPTTASPPPSIQAVPNIYISRKLSQHHQQPGAGVNPRYNVILS